MENKQVDKHNQPQDVLYGYLEKISSTDVMEANSAEQWFKKTLCESNGSYQLKLGVYDNEFGMHKHDNTDEIFFVLDGVLDVVTEDQTFELHKYEGVCIPKGVMHRSAATKGKVSLLMFIGK